MRTKPKRYKTRPKIGKNILVELTALIKEIIIYIRVVKKEEEVLAEWCL